MNNDLISRDALKKDIDFQHICECCHNNGITCDVCIVSEIEKKIDDAPIVDLWKMRQEATENALKKAEVLYERPQGECIEVKHRLNLLIGVLYSNQLISNSDIKYIEDSIKKLMKGDKA